MPRSVVGMSPGEHRTSAENQNTCPGPGAGDSPESIPKPNICTRIRDKVTLALAERISMRLYSSGVSTSPIDYSMKVLKELVIFSSLILALLLLRPLLPSEPFTYLLAGATILPAALVIDLLLRPLLATYNRKKACERELPFFATYLTMASASGIPATSAFEHLKDLKHLPQFKKEWYRIEKVRRLYALNPFEAILFEGKHHPLDSVKDLYITSISAQREGGEVLSVMRYELLKLFSLLQGRLKTFSDKFSLMTSAEIIAFIMLPMGTITVGVLFSGILGVPILFFACFVFPTIVAVFLSLMIDTYTPKELTEDVDHGALVKFLLPVLPFALLLVRVFGPALPLYYAFGISLVTFTLPAVRHYAPARKRTKEVIAALPSFTRSIAEEVKKGVSPRMAMIKLCEGRSFNASFDRLLHRLASYLKVGCPIAGALSCVEGPWIAKVSLELLDRAEVMGADPKSLDFLSELVANMFLGHKSMESQTRFFVVMSYVNTLLLAFSTSIVVEIVARLFTRVAEAVTIINLPLGMSFISGEQLNLLIVVAYTAVVYNSYLLGLLGGKVSNGGSIVDGLLSSTVCTALSMAGILLFKDLGFIRALTLWGQ
jgi:pilus assembly protein TadC